MLLASSSPHQLKYHFFPTGSSSSALNSRSADYLAAPAADWRSRMEEIAGIVEILICITLYNEDGDALLYSLAAIQQNINYLVAIGREDIAASLTVCIIADGHANMSDSMRTLVTRLGLYVPERLAPDAALHVFENRLAALVLHEQMEEHQANAQSASSWQAVYSAAGYDHERLISSHPTTMITPRTFFCIKPTNAGKLNSHGWFFNAFCPYLQPKYCVQMDVGSVPQENTLLTLRQHLERNPAVGAATNSLLTQEPSLWWDVLSVWQYTNFVFTNLIHSPAEQLSGYVSVMCGQFSLFRWQALSNGNMDSRNDLPKKDSPLQQYLKEPEQPSMLKANMLLTEDRVLCLALKTNRQQRWKLAYVPTAVTVTDTCPTLPELLRQRRRWINGAFSCRLVLLSQMIKRLFSPRISATEKWDLLRALPLYFTRALSEWFNPALSLTISIGVFQLALAAATTLGLPTHWIYVCFLLEISFSLARLRLCLQGNLTASALRLSVIYLSIYLGLVLGLICLVGNFWLIGIITIAWLISFLSALSYSPNLAVKAAQYFIPMIITDAVLTPLIRAYASNNISDASWGTKGQTGKRGYKWGRRYFIAGWLTSNFLLLGVLLSKDLFVASFIFQCSPWLLGGISGILVGLQTRQKKRREQLRKVFSPIA